MIEIDFYNALRNADGGDDDVPGEVSAVIRVVEASVCMCSRPSLDHDGGRCDAKVTGTTTSMYAPIGFLLSSLISPHSSKTKSR
jgi:hypothetical protein